MAVAVAYVPVAVTHPTHTHTHCSLTHVCTSTCDASDRGTVDTDKQLRQKLGAVTAEAAVAGVDSKSFTADDGTKAGHYEALLWHRSHYDGEYAELRALLARKAAAAPRCPQVALS